MFSLIFIPKSLFLNQINTSIKRMVYVCQHRDFNWGSSNILKIIKGALNFYSHTII